MAYIFSLSSRCPTILSPGGYAFWTLRYHATPCTFSKVSCFPLPWPAEGEHWSIESVFLLSISNIHELPGNLLKNIAGYDAKGMAHLCSKKVILWYIRVSKPRERSERCFSICIKSGEFGSDTLWEAFRPGVAAEEKNVHFFSLFILSSVNICFWADTIFCFKNPYNITWKSIFKSIKTLSSWLEWSQSSGGVCLCSGPHCHGSVSFG